MMHSLLKCLQHEAWEISIQPPSLLKLAELLTNTNIQLSSEGITSTRINTSSNFLNFGETHTAPEIGISIKASTASRVYLLDGTNNHKQVSLLITTTCLADNLCISFDACETNTPILNQIIESVTSTIPLERFLQRMAQADKTCPCCRKEKQKIRLDHTIHPLSALLSYIKEQGITISIEHGRSQTSAHTAILPSDEVAHAGVVHLISNTQQCAIDLTSVFNVRVHLDINKGTPRTRLVAYSSYGHKLFQLIDEQRDTFDIWNQIMQKKRPKAKG